MTKLQQNGRRIGAAALLLFLLLSGMLCSCASTLPAPAPTPTPSENGTKTELTLGNGATTVTVTVVDDKENQTIYTLHTDKTTLREAMDEYELISGTDSQYGLMVDTVCGVRADYSVNQSWWKILIGEETAPTGVDGIHLTDGASYSFVYTIG